MHPKQWHFHVARVGKQISKTKAGPKFINSVSRVNNPAASTSGMTCGITYNFHLLLEVNLQFIMSQKKMPKEPHL